MDMNTIFIVGIGKVNEPDSLELARKIFVDNQHLLKPSLDSGNFSTSLGRYYFKKSDICEYSNTDDIEQLKQVIKKNAFKYLEGVGYDIQEFDLDVPNLWLNEMRGDSAHPPHTHYGFNLSGTYYVDVPKDSGSILFANPMVIDPCMYAPIQQHSPFNAKYCTINTKDGDMLFWKSNLEHSVPFAKFDGVRRTIAFDVLITPKS